MNLVFLIALNHSALYQELDFLALINVDSKVLTFC